MKKRRKLAKPASRSSSLESLEQRLMMSAEHPAESPWVASSQHIGPHAVSDHPLMGPQLPVADSHHTGAFSTVKALSLAQPVVVTVAQPSGGIATPGLLSDGYPVDITNVTATTDASGAVTVNWTATPAPSAMTMAVVERQVVGPFLPSTYGDFDGNGQVDLADYGVWFNNYGQTITAPPPTSGGSGSMSSWVTVASLPLSSVGTFVDTSVVGSAFWSYNYQVVAEVNGTPISATPMADDANSRTVPEWFKEMSHVIGALSGTGILTIPTAVPDVYTLEFDAQYKQRCLDIANLPEPHNDPEKDARCIIWLTLKERSAGRPVTLTPEKIRIVHDAGLQVP